MKVGSGPWQSVLKILQSSPTSLCQGVADFVVPKGSLLAQQSLTRKSK